MLTLAAGGWVRYGRRKGSEGWWKHRKDAVFIVNYVSALAGKAWPPVMHDRMLDDWGGGGVGTVCSSTVRYGTYRIVPRRIDINIIGKACRSCG